MLRRRHRVRISHRFAAPTVGFLLFAASTAQAQDGRNGFWLGIGTGRGWDITQALDLKEPPGGIAAYIRAGGTLTEQVLLGVEVIGRSVDDGDVTLTRGNATFSMLIFPSPSGGFFIKGGVGLASWGASSQGQIGSNSYGLGLTAGAGFDVRLGGNLYITPNVDFLYQSFHAGANLRSTSRLLLLTAGLTWH